MTKTPEPPPRPGVATPEIANLLRAAEYASVRTEWLSARDAQQSTLQWTLAALGVLLAGLVTSDFGTQRPFVFIAVATSVVAIALCSEAIWFGEVMRMERASCYLRGLEKALWPLVPAGEYPLLMWETWRGDDKMHGKTPWVHKAKPSIIASFALYGVIATAGVVILASEGTAKHVSASHHVLARWLAGGTGAVYLAVILYLCVEAVLMFRVSTKYANFETIAAVAADEFLARNVDPHSDSVPPE